MAACNLGGRFNEAGAVMPRKGRHDKAPARPESWASMRPGLLCPGRANHRDDEGQTMAVLQ